MDKPIESLQLNLCTYYLGGIFLARLWPASLKNKLFVAFILCIFIPLSVGFFYIFSEIEATLQDKIIEKSTLNLKMTRKSFDDVLSILTKAFYIVEKDPTIAAQLQDPSQYSDFKRTRVIEDKLVSLDDSLFYIIPLKFISLWPTLRAICMYLTCPSWL